MEGNQDRGWILFRFTLIQGGTMLFIPQYLVSKLEGEGRAFSGPGGWGWGLQDDKR